MKAFKLCETAQLKNLSSSDNGKSGNNYAKSAESKKNGDVLCDKSKVFKQRLSSSTSAQSTDDRIDSASAKKQCNIEKFLSSAVPSGGAATVETARNGFLAAAAAAQQYTPFNLFTPYLKDMFIAAQLLRGKPETFHYQQKKNQRKTAHEIAKLLKFRSKSNRSRDFAVILILSCSTLFSICTHVLRARQSDLM